MPHRSQPPLREAEESGVRAALSRGHLLDTRPSSPSKPRMWILSTSASEMRGQTWPQPMTGVCVCVCVIDLCGVTVVGTDISPWGGRRGNRTRCDAVTEDPSSVPSTHVGGSHRQLVPLASGHLMHRPTQTNITIRNLRKLRETFLVLGTVTGRDWSLWLG